jgi:hypothetical protein
VALRDDLDEAAAAASGHGAVSAVLAAEPASGLRAYLVAVGEEDDRSWVVLDASFQPVERRERVREVASIVVLCELAGELAGGGGLEELRSRLASVRMAEHPPGIEDAEDAALELERAIGAPPIVASPTYLDEVGARTRELEAALGDQGSPFAASLASSSGTVEAFVAEVESRNLVPLR